ncbi:serine/arginine-rich splicing factor 6-like [Corticium candelabrum]|uniref:serine/arginine-rich splicing factor 6-like n=1 Tax=Corticium candelabrum TaxID=121492 RepID=UPI002E26BC28|nr:serine/arginine-rich splicing factor 6-like [Corticium candelabrum]
MARVYVGRLSYDVRERDLQRFFRGFGRIREINVKNGFGFVEFDDPRDADDAVYEMNGRDLLGERVLVEHARGSRGGSRYSSGGGGGGGGGGGSAPYMRGNRPRDKYGPPLRTDYRLIVDNLSSRTSWQDLKDYCRTAGCEVTYADAHKQRVGEAVIDFASKDDMKRALRKLDGTELNGKRITLQSEDKRASSRSRSRSRNRSRSPRRSRSYSRSRSRSASANKKSPSRSKSRSVSPARSPSPRQESRSRSRSPAEAEEDGDVEQ